MVAASPVRIDRGRVEELAAREQKRLDASTQKSGEMYEWARRTLAGGVASSYQVRDPWPIYITEGRGSKVWDVDGTERIDYHNGFGSMVQGHANPYIVEAVQKQVARGTHFAAPVEDGIVPLCEAALQRMTTALDDPLRAEQWHEANNVTPRKVARRLLHSFRRPQRC